MEKHNVMKILRATDQELKLAKFKVNSIPKSTPLEDEEFLKNLSQSYKIIKKLNQLLK
ncbi:hypothetical protein RZE82_07010 [Mollicutes bacterium LVI A0039]|nr:hypothetical protein RZE82_07010 [Mollicutes bacterium LVI A0039]